MTGQPRPNEESRREPSRTMMCRGVRGAITVTSNTEEDILEGTRDLLQAILQSNEMRVEDIASIHITTTKDLTATYPAYAARQLGWNYVALMCGHEIDVPGGLANCIRVLLHWNTPRPPSDIVHVYMREAHVLRPDRNNTSRLTPADIIR